MEKPRFFTKSGFSKKAKTSRKKHEKTSQKQYLNNKKLMVKNVTLFQLHFSTFWCQSGRPQAHKVGSKIAIFVVKSAFELCSPSCVPKNNHSNSPGVDFGGAWGAPGPPNGSPNCYFSIKKPLCVICECENLARAELMQPMRTQVQNAFREQKDK